MKKLNKKGFTIVELVIVIAVIAILAAVLIPTFATVIQKANESAALQNARNTFTEYIASLGDKIPDKINLIVKGSENMYFTVVNGQMNKTVYTTSASAFSSTASFNKSTSKAATDSFATTVVTIEPPTT